MSTTSNHSIISNSSLKSIESSKQNMFKEMIKKVIMDMVSEGVGTGSTDNSIVSEVSSAGRKKKDKRESKRKNKRRSAVQQKRLSILSLVGEVSEEFDLSDDDVNFDDSIIIAAAAAAAAEISDEEEEASISVGGRKSKSEGKKKKDKKKQSEDSSDSKKKEKRKSKTGRKSKGESVVSISTRTSRSSRASLRGSTTSRSKRNNSNNKTSSSAALKLRIEEAINELNNLRLEEKKEQQRHSIRSIPTELLDCDDDDHSDSGSVSTLGTTGSTWTMSSTRSKPGSRQFNQEMASKLHSHRKTLCIQDNAVHKYPEDNDTTTNTTAGGNGNGNGNSNSNNNIVDDDDDVIKSEIDDFVAAFDPNEMRCLALVSHNEMKTTMKDFVIKYKNVLKKFRLTGTNSTMTMLGQVFKGDKSVVFGPACSSGPLGGDAELVAMMAQGQLGAILFFQDPMTSHPHQVDIECLVRQALVHNTVIATTPTTAMTIMEVFKMALMGNGRPELLPSFFFSLQSPTVESYKRGQAKVIENRS